MLKFAYLAGALMVIASPAVAQTPATGATATDVPSAKSSDVDRIVCKKEETVGSRLAAKKVCLTVKEWEARASEDRHETDRVQRDTRMGTPSG